MRIEVPDAPNPIRAIGGGAIGGANSWFTVLVYGALGTISGLIFTFYTMDSASDQLQSMFLGSEETFDFVIVGGGSAGNVVANRLSAQDFKVLLLEAGGEQQPITLIPSLSLIALDRPFIDWRYYTIPQKAACLAMNGEQCFHPRGLGLGGSSNLNFMIYMRGHQNDYDNWANITNDPRWSYEEVLPFFRRSEDYTGEWDNPRYHSHGGYLKVSEPNYKGMAEDFCKACQDMGIPRTDLNAQFTEGCSPIYNTQHQGRRHSTYSAFIEPIRNRPNLFIYKFAHVNKVHIDEFNRAYAVQYSRHNKNYLAYAKREIILSAGAFNSPKILMLSGIGPKDHLEAMNIPLRMELPVGKNLQDHISSFIGPFVIEEPKSMILDRDMTPKALQDYLAFGAGPASSTGIQASAFIISSKAKAKGDLQSGWPDIQYLLLGSGVYKQADEDFSRSFNIKPGILDQFLKPLMGYDSFQIINMLSRPVSRGEVLLSSADPKAYPLINPRYLTEPEDVHVIVEGAKRAVEIVENSTTFQSMGAHLSPIPFPPCEHFPFRSNEYWECHVRHYSMTIYHPSGTCAMGKKDSKASVVDSELRVIGIQGLRVIDASVMPTITSGNTNAPTIMIGEMGSQFILDFWKGNFN